MSFIPNFRTFKLLVIFSLVIFNYANSESIQKEWEEHSENIIILDTDEVKNIVNSKSAILLDTWKKDIKPEALDPKKWMPAQRYSIPGAKWIPNAGLETLTPELRNYFEETVKTGFGAVVGSGFLTGFVLLLGIIGQLSGGRLGEIFQRKNLYVWVVGLNIPFLILMAFYQGWILVGITGILGAINFMFQPVNNSLLADVTPIGNRGIIYGFSAGISFSVGSFAGIIGGYLGEALSINHIFPSMALFLIPAVLLAILLKKFM